MFFKKGMLYKQFNIKQIEGNAVRPTVEERDQLLGIFKDNKNNGESSDEYDETEQLLMQRDNDFKLNDKVFVSQGELQGSYGVIKGFGDNRNQVVFKPTSIEGWDENLQIDIKMIIKHFDVGDLVKIMDGRYEGEIARVTKLNEEDISLPTIKLEDSNRELQKSTHCLCAINEKDIDDIKAVKARA